MISEADEDAIDLQDLQAQIDLSMSFAQNLVTSWVEPMHYSQTNRQKILENEMKEYMRRPIRLGVGAPIPSAQSLTREATRLKFKLEGGNKRHREDEDVDVKKPESDDEGESRAGAIKKRTRVDSFSVLSKKGKKSGPAVHPAAMKAMSNSPAEVEEWFDMDEVAEELLITSESPEILMKKKANQTEDEPICAEEQRMKSSKNALLSQVNANVDEAPSSRSEPSKHPQTCALDTSLSPRQSSAASPAALSKIGISLNTSLLSLGHRTGVSSPKQPLLNLHDPPSQGESGEDELSVPSIPTPKKKRKRRKKKKPQQNTEAT